MSAFRCWQELWSFFHSCSLESSSRGSAERVRKDWYAWSAQESALQHPPFITEQSYTRLIQVSEGSRSSFLHSVALKHNSDIQKERAQTATRAPSNGLSACFEFSEGDLESDGNSAILDSDWSQVSPLTSQVCVNALMTNMLSYLSEHVTRGLGTFSGRRCLFYVLTFSGSTLYVFWHPHDAFFSSFLVTWQTEFLCLTISKRKTGGGLVRGHPVYSCYKVSITVHVRQQKRM